MEFLVPAAAAVGGMFLATQSSRARKRPPASWDANKYPWAEEVNSVSGKREERYVGPDRVTAQNSVGYYPESTQAVDKYFGSVVYEAEADATPGELTLLSGETIPARDFAHGNQQPFFGSTVKQPKFSGRATEARLDSGVGAGSQYAPKVEQAPLFKPTTGYSYANGAPSSSDFVHSRQVPAMRAANVAPFEQERVGPGLDAGYGTAGAGGFNAGAMARDKYMPKGVDELRPATQPKHIPSEYTSTPGGNQLNTQRGVVGEVARNRPERSFAIGPDRYLTTVGGAEGPMAHSTQIQRPLRAEGTSRAAFGPGVQAQGGEASTRGIAAPVRRDPALRGPATVMPAAAAQGQMGPAEPQNLVRSGYKALPNARMETGQKTDGLWGTASAVVSEMFAPLIDSVRAPRRGDYVGRRRLGGAGGGARQGSIARSTDVPKYKQQLPAPPQGPAMSAHPAPSMERAAKSDTADPTRRAQTQYSYTPGAQSAQGPSAYGAAYASAIGPSKEATLLNRHNQGGTNAFNNAQGSVRPKQALAEPPPPALQGRSAIPTMDIIGQSSLRKPVRFEVAGDRLASEAVGGMAQHASNNLAVRSFA